LGLWLYFKSGLRTDCHLQMTAAKLAQHVISYPSSSTYPSPRNLTCEIRPYHLNLIRITGLSHLVTRCALLSLLLSLLSRYPLVPVTYP